MQVVGSARRRRRHDRLSKLSDATMGRILSFLPAKEAARASAPSSRWRNAYAGVDAVSLEQPESPIPDYKDYGCGCMDCSYGRPVDPNPKPPFTATVTAALLARHRVPAAPAPPLRALRVALDYYRREDASTVDHWVSYALKYAAPAPVGLELDLRLRRVPICARPYSLSATSSRKRSRSSDTAEEEEEGEKSVSDDDSSRWPQYTVPVSLFSCAALRSLSLGPCTLSPPASASLPSLETLLLARVSDHEQSVQRLVDACPRLTDLTLEACGTVTALYLDDNNRRLRKLAIRCCHKLAFVAVDDRLHSLEYRGAVPDRPLFAFRGGGLSKLTSCTIDICGKEVSSAQELTKLGKFLKLVAAPTNHLHLRSARLGCGVEHDALLTSLPVFTSLLHLELTGRLPHRDGDAAVTAVSRILLHAPSLEVLSLFLDTDPGDKILHERESWDDYKEGELLGAHPLRYNKHDEVLGRHHTAGGDHPCLSEETSIMNTLYVFYGEDINRDGPSGLDLSRCETKNMIVEELVNVSFTDVRRRIRAEFGLEMTRKKMTVEAVICKRVGEDYRWALRQFIDASDEPGSSTAAGELQLSIAAMAINMEMTEERHVEDALVPTQNNGPYSMAVFDLNERIEG
uniref:Uncharacterized protein n=1 Tax=Avena sativa TaxID=4498 RepID=A0ACD5W2T6_AVESA